MTGNDDRRRAWVAAWLTLLAEFAHRMIQPLLAVWFGAAIIVLTFMGMITPDAFLGVSSMVIGFFVNAKLAERAEERMHEQQNELIALAKALPPPPAPFSGPAPPPPTGG